MNQQYLEALEREFNGLFQVQDERKGRIIDPYAEVVVWIKSKVQEAYELGKQDVIPDPTAKPQKIVQKPSEWIEERAGRKGHTHVEDYLQAKLNVVIEYLDKLHSEGKI